MRAQLIFNPASGNPSESAAQLLQLLCQLQTVNIRAEVLVVQPGMRLHDIARRAVQDGARMVIVSGGDGTIENVALGLVDSPTTLGIIPTGTRNNLARSLGIPTDSIANAAGLLRMGRRVKVDVGEIRRGDTERVFLEAGAIGLASALFPSADDIQHGDIGKIGEFIATFLTHTPSEIRLRLDGARREIITTAHLVLIANMPYMGANYQIAPDVAFDDHRLDVVVYSNLSKVDLIGKAIQSDAGASDGRIQRYRARRVEIATNPAMPVMADGVLLGEGPVTVQVRPRSLAVMMGETQAAVAPQESTAASEAASEATSEAES
jgi:diacylglycerol kinase (ATP)